MKCNPTLLTTTAMVVISTIAGPALAQTSNSAASATGASEIVVTAQRRSERLEDVPMSVTAVSPETLAKSGVTGLQEIGRLSPGVQINFAGAFTQPAIRGVTTLTNAAGAENNVAIYVDGFYVPDSLSINTDLANIADIQILKGPQGTLYGRNATGGAILINTLAPSDTLTGKGELEYGRFNNLAGKGYVSGPLSEKIRFSLAASARDSDGYIKLVDPTQIGKKDGNAAPLKSQSVRFKLEADLTDSLTATLGLNYGYTSDPRGSLFTPRQYKTAILPAPPLIATDLDTASYNHGAKVTAKTYEPNLTLAWASDIGTLTSRTSYGWRKFAIDYDFDGSYKDLGFSSSRYKSDTFQQSADYAIKAIDRLDLVVGGLYYEDHFNPGNGQYMGIAYGANLAPLTGSTVALDTTSYAVFADATYALTDKLSINAGARYSHDKKSIAEFVQNLNTLAYTLAPTTNEAKFHKVTPRASIRYELARRTNIYASYSVGYRSGSFNANPVNTPAQVVPVKPETLKAYEVGFKTARSAFRFEAAAFLYDYTNYNVSLTQVNAATGGISTVIANAPKAKIKGVEVQLTVMPIARTNITLAGSYLHARYGAFPNASGTGLNAATGLNVGSQTQDWTGQQMSRAPNFSGSVAADHTFDLLGGSLLTSANLAYSDGYVISNPSLFGPLAPAALRTKQRYRQGKTTLVNAQITWTDPSGHYFFGVWGKNLTNEKYRATYNGTSSYGDYSIYNAPITYGVRTGFTF